MQFEQYIFQRSGVRLVMAGSKLRPAFTELDQRNIDAIQAGA